MYLPPSTTSIYVYVYYYIVELIKVLLHWIGKNTGRNRHFGDVNVEVLFKDRERPHMCWKTYKEGCKAWKSVSQQSL